MSFEARLALHRQAYREGLQTPEYGHITELVRQTLRDRALRASYELGRLHRAWGLTDIKKS